VRYAPQSSGQPPALSPVKSHDCKIHLWQFRFLSRHSYDLHRKVRPPPVCARPTLKCGSGMNSQGPVACDRDFDSVHSLLHCSTLCIKLACFIYPCGVTLPWVSAINSLNTFNIILSVPCDYNHSHTTPTNAHNLYKSKNHP
jgi:hypothetical protein